MKKLKAKGRAILRAKDSVKVPHFNPINYTLSMIQSLNYYSAEVDDDSKKRKFAYQYWKGLGLEVEKLNPLSDGWFHTVGAVAHMALNGVPLSDHDTIRLNNAYHALVEKTKEESFTSPKTTVPKPTIQDRTNEIASKHIGEFEAAIDGFILNNEEFDVKAYIQKNEVKGGVTKKIGDWFKPKAKEIEIAYSGNDAELADAYSYLGKRKLKKLVEFMSNIVTSCDNMATIAKTMRKPRARKQQPPGKIVSKLKYMREFPDLGLKSIDPTKIVGATQVWVYNTKLRKLFKYDALDGMEFSVRGTTLLNFDPAKSGGKIMRKPEVQLKGVADMTKRPLTGLFNEVKATMSKATGRINEDYIIIGAF